MIIIPIKRVWKPTGDSPVILKVRKRISCLIQEQEVNKIINQMKKIGVRKCGASHCTGERQIQIFKEAFGDDYITMGVGRLITF